jgi:GDP-D-mannose dehydratase
LSRKSAGCWERTRGPPGYFKRGSIQRLREGLGPSGPTDPDDYAIATGETHSVREFCEAAYADANLDYRDSVVVDEHFCRPAEVDLLVGDSSKARRAFGWEPKITFRELAREMVREDIARH